ncbi:AAA family ATPase [Clostridium weizhouense]|uniref:ATP-binding protein n=1 Tax=Clostridium weizhouense TaxID=2859781 RepID=A0ABS7ANQ2_9CLOT|nr:AAA family ATPase [Clostridium weizhouense]MBW6410304.1 ATP-binding protein [Clostridium weizhouense]
MKKTIQVGTSNFGELISCNHYFVDKSLLIKEFIENGAKVILTPRPRRFGKTLNMSMLKHFFDVEKKEENKNLFKGLKIEREEEIMNLQGEFPVIFMSFKNEKYSTFEEFKYGIKSLIIDLYRKNINLLESPKLISYDKQKFDEILSGKAEMVDYYKGLSNLMYYMNIHYNKNVMVFIDEYDIPVQESYLKGYYEDAITVIRVMLTAALKDNVYLEKALVTGILRVAKESIFSGLNNMQVHTMFSYRFNDKFGFTEDEVKELLKYYNLTEKMDEVKKWYNGYIFGGKVIYNPWSVLNYISENKIGFMPYWINSSSNDLIKRLLSKGSEDTKKNLEELINGNSINKIVDDHIVMKEVEEDEENLWSFLTLSGYLKPVNSIVSEGKFNCELKIPNNEVLIFYKNLIEKWFKESLKNEKYNTMLKALVSGDVEIFGGFFQKFVLNNLSYFDVSGEEPERVYHAFVLGMIVSLSDKYEVKSNKESGYGRYDVMLIPKNSSKLGIIMEFKKIDDFMNKTMEKGIEEALNQIEENKYETELKERGISDILKLAIVFKGKKVKVVEG